ncbi:PTS transporter subunit EIIC [Serratia marcescens]|uniref:PTS transporter subunit EIIC n=2 Tax=Serratia marcescens TaxID=615 RepID=UPI002881D91B|nr:PTS transporter subunit EIIC [Serratia marcescens]MDT0204575.1 PTS transporter subunit EIIC [Serratia marcescens]
MSKYDIAKEIVSALGGAGNIRHITHCATRLRINLVSTAQLDNTRIKKIDKVLGTVSAGGQYQIIVGNDVGDIYQAISQQLHIEPPPATVNEGVSPQATEKSSIFDIISGSFLPLLGLLAGGGMLKVLLTLAQQSQLMSPDNGTFSILSSIANAPFYFLPALLGCSLAKRLGANPYMGLIIGASLLEPSLITLMNGSSLSFIGLPVIPQNYGSSVFPVFIAVLFFSWLEKKLKQLIPTGLQLFLLPMLSLMIVVPFTLLVFGPFGMLIGNTIAKAVLALSGINGLLTGVILGGCYTFIVVLGLHWGLVPIVLANLAAGGDPLYAIGGMSGFAQMGIALGFMLKSRQKPLRILAGTAFIPAIFSGVTEPIIYGLMLPYRRTFLYVALAGAIGGGINGFFQVRMVSYAFASFLGIPAYSPMGVYLISALITVAVASLLVVLFGYQPNPKGDINHD